MKITIEKLSNGIHPYAQITVDASSTDINDLQLIIELQKVVNEYNEQMVKLA